MKRLLSILFVGLALIWASPIFAGQTFTRSCLVDSGSSCVDALSISGDSLATGDRCMTTYAGFVYWHIYDATATEAEDSPWVIRPNDYSTQGNWEFVSRIQSSKDLMIVVFGSESTVTTGDGKLYIPVGPEISGRKLKSVYAQVVQDGTTGTTDVQIARCAAAATGDACSGTVNDMLSTKLTIDSGEDSSETAATAAVINDTYSQVTTYQTLRIDVDAVSTTPPTGLSIRMGFE